MMNVFDFISQDSSIARGLRELCRANAHHATTPQPPTKCWSCNKPIFGDVKDTPDGPECQNCTVLGYQILIDELGMTPEAFIEEAQVHQLGIRRAAEALPTGYASNSPGAASANSTSGGAA